MKTLLSCPQCGKRYKATRLDLAEIPLCPNCDVELRVERWAEEPDPLSEAAEDEGLLLPPPAKQPEDLIDMTSMVDIVFFLLIFFLVTSMQALESVMDMPPPKAATGMAGTTRSLADLASENIQVKIEDDNSIWVEDTQTFTEADLRIRLKQAHEDMPTASGVLVTGNADASHGAAVMVFDACADANLGNVLFAVEDSEPPE